MLKNKTVLIGITGGIAAYKICELVRMFKRQNANVRVVCTQNALEFVTKITLQNLSGNEVSTEQFEVEEFKPEHISYADEADIMVIAPCTANTLSKIANGYCDNLLTSIVCAFNKPIIIAPAMNCNMWENEIIQENLNKLYGLGYEILEPETGYLACGYEGQGRLCGLQKIFDKTIEILNRKQKLAGKKIVITAGGTIENIDPVRYISNHSSGKMGRALAKVAQEQGAEVVLIDAKEHSALTLKSAVETEFDTADCIIMAAAVADYRVKEVSEQKIKKDGDFPPLSKGGIRGDCSKSLCLELVPNPDILAELCQKPRNGKIIVGFCAETENLEQNVIDKIQRKDCDFLVANDVSRSDIGFSSNENEVLIVDKNLNTEKIEKTSKIKIAERIFEKIYG